MTYKKSMINVFDVSAFKPKDFPNNNQGAFVAKPNHMQASGFKTPVSASKNNVVLPSLKKTVPVNIFKGSNLVSF